MKQYQGLRTHSDRNSVLVNGQELKHYARHSPDGFEWGYGGSGPSELARCILIDYFDDIPKADKHYQQFKFDIIAVIKEDSWVITSEDIEKWLAKNDENLKVS